MKEVYETRENELTWIEPGKKRIIEFKEQLKPKDIENKMRDLSSILKKATNKLLAITNLKIK